MGTSGAGATGDGGEGGTPSCDGSISYTATLRTQADVEAFRNVGTMLAGLEITGDVEDLSPLGCLTNGPTTLTIFDTTRLTNLHGLEGIGSLEGTLEIRTNAALASLQGLMLESVGGLTIDRNPLLADLDGLSTLTSVLGDVMLHQNDALVDITGLRSLSELSGRFGIRFNAKLPSLDGLENITRAMGLSVDGNSVLTSLEGVRNLREVGGLVIDGNPMLASLGGLEGLVSIADTLWLFNNPRVTTLEPLANLTTATKLHVAYMSGLESLAGLENAEIQMDVSIHHNENLVTTRGLKPRSDGRGLYEIGVSENPRLTSLEGFSGASGAVGFIQISSNESLATLSGLDGIFGADRVEILWNPALRTLEGLGDLTTVTDFVAIENNESLVSLEGLGSLRECALSVSGNSALTSVDGLESMRIALALFIVENPSLRSLRGLDLLENVENEFSILDNVALPTCEAFWLRDSVRVDYIGGPIEIAGNDDDGTCP
jgi:hypothetical protein